MITMVSNGNIYIFFMTKFIIRHPLCGSFDCVLTHLKDLRFATYSYKSLMLVDHDLKSSWFGQGIPQKTSSLESYSNCGGSYYNDGVEPFNYLISSNKGNIN
jgi:hypothetical protein